MTDNKKRPASSINKQSELLTFQFSESKQEIRNLLIESKPWFVAKDICDVLELQNSRQAVKELDDDEKLMYKLYTSGQNRKTWLVSESGLYALILRSNKPQAKAFRKWITSEVIPTLLKKGFYAMNNQQKDNFIDARDIPFYTKPINGYNVRCIELENQVWVVINDANKAIHSSTSSNQLAKKLNARQILAKKIWLFGNTNPAWCTNQLGLQLLLAGSRKFSNQLNLSI
tara:strand:+ start:18781 stop:19467 length:687 start_codon:yes stop_codon:yes gene_type:complete